MTLNAVIGNRVNTVLKRRKTWAMMTVLKTVKHGKKGERTMSMVVDIHKKNGKRAEFDVYIGRKIQYHKEFIIDSKWRNRSKTLEEYEDWVRTNLWEDLDELKGKTLGCWCVTTKELEPVKCHGQILMQLLLEKEVEE